MDYLKLIFYVILILTTITILTATNCPSHNYHIGNGRFTNCSSRAKCLATQFTWPEAPSNDEWIPTNCLDQEKLLVFRKCVNGTWTPNNTEFQMKCHFENVENPSADCPHNFKTIQLQESYAQTEKTICIRKKGLQYDYIVDKSACVQDSIFTVNLNIDQHTEFIEKVIQEYPNDTGLFVQGIRWRYPCKEIHEHVSYDVELHDVRCGRYELPLKFNKTVPVNCTLFVCADICLYLNVTTQPFTPSMGPCNEYVIAKPKNTFLHAVGCPSGYYRASYDYVETDRSSCFSIQIFPQPIPVKNVTDARIIGTYCSERIMEMVWGDDLFVFRQLSEQIGLSNGNYCLFGILTNRTIKYSDWNSGLISRTPYLFNWEKTMNYSRIIAPDAESYLAVRPNGQYTWALDSVTCIACMVKRSIPLPIFRLEYKIFERKLELEVTDQDFLLKEKSFDRGFICFSLFREVYKANLTVFPIGCGRYLLEDVGIGQYWCSGHTVINRNHIWNGERMFAYGVWLVFEVVRKCSTTCSFRTNDLNQFVDIFKRNNGYVSIKGSTIVEHELPISDTEYSFTVLLSLTLHGNPNNVSVINMTAYELETFLIFDHVNKKVNGDGNEMDIKSITSTEYCLHESPFSIDAIIWGIARIGETVSPSRLCPIHESSQKISRTCSGDSVNGLFWEKVVDVPQCHTFVSDSLIKLYADFKYPSQTTPMFEHVKNLLTENVQRLLPLDVFLTSRILLKELIITATDIQSILSIYNSFLQTDESSLQISAYSNSTNILLEAFDNILLGYIESSIIGSSEYQKYGNTSMHSPLIETFVLDPTVSGVSGIALYRDRSTSDCNFTTYSRRHIHSNETIPEIMTDKDLVVGSYIPTDMLNNLTNIRIVITVFFNDKLFQSTNTSLADGSLKTGSKIISIRILGLGDGVSFPYKVPVIFETNRSSVSTCSLWNLTSINGWSSIGCNLKEIFASEFQQFVVCECPLSTHITNHSHLIDDTHMHSDNTHDNKMTKIRVLTSSFSFFATFVIFLTAVVSKEWRKQLNSKIQIHFSVSVTLEMILAILVSFDDYISVIASNTVASVALGSMLHYSSLTIFLWMLIFVYFRLKRFLTVFSFNLSHLLAKSIIFGWIVPLLPVITILIDDHSLYLSVNKNELQFYPTGWTLYLGVVAPIGLIIFLIYLLFIAVFINLYKNSHSQGMVEATKFRMTMLNILLSALLCITLGLTWIFGFLSKILPSSYTLFSFLFSTAATIQALVLLFYFIVFDLLSFCGIFYEIFN